MDQGTEEDGRWAEHLAFADLEIPPSLDASLMKHRAHLAELVRNLHSAGVSEAHIEESVSTIVASYREELIQAIKAMVA